MVIHPPVYIEVRRQGHLIRVVVLYVHLHLHTSGEAAGPLCVKMVIEDLILNPINVVDSF